MDDEKLIIGYAKLAEYLTECGFPISPSTATKYGSPKIDKGPPKEGYWGNQPIFKPSRSLEWARSRAGISS
jgi:hypothetical protein